MLVTVRQLPAPSHVRAGVSVDPVQLPAAQTEPAAQLWHAPLPSHVPSNPHSVWATAGHCVVTMGAVPLGTFEQVPTFPVSVHVMHVPVHAVLQQTPCTQFPDVHWALLAQVAPFVFVVHAPLLQVFGATQSVSTVQVVLQTLLVVSQL